MIEHSFPIISLPPLTSSLSYPSPHSAPTFHLIPLTPSLHPFPTSHLIPLLPLTSPSLSPHLPLSFPSPHLPLSFPSPHLLTFTSPPPLLHFTFPSPSPHLPLSFPSPSPHLPLTFLPSPNLWLSPSLHVMVIPEGDHEGYPVTTRTRPLMFLGML